LPKSRISVREKNKEKKYCPYKNKYEWHIPEYISDKYGNGSEESHECIGPQTSEYNLWMLKVRDNLIGDYFPLQSY
jgi:hypothetical protein